MYGVSDCIVDRVWLAIPQATEWQRIGDQIKAAMIFAGPDLVNVHRNRRWHHGRISFAAPQSKTILAPHWSSLCVERRSEIAYRFQSWSQENTTTSLAPTEMKKGGNDCECFGAERRRVDGCAEW
jgi:hypothetical protein